MIAHYTSIATLNQALQVLATRDAEIERLKAELAATRPCVAVAEENERLKADLIRERADHQSCDDKNETEIQDLRDRQIPGLRRERDEALRRCGEVEAALAAERAASENLARELNRCIRDLSAERATADANEERYLTTLAAERERHRRQETLTPPRGKGQG